MIQEQSNVLGKQSGFLLSTYQAEFANDRASRATESSRSNVIALWHTIQQIYGKAAARDVANLVYTSTKTASCKPRSVRPILSFACICLHAGC
jgi:hypothetical protein